MESKGDDSGECRFVDLDSKNTKLANVLNEFGKKVHDTANRNGWWDKDRSELDCICLMHAELSEATEACRIGPDDPCDKNIPITALEEELADCIIRILDFAQWRGCNIGLALKLKAQYNETREYRHGNKRY